MSDFELRLYDIICKVYRKQYIGKLWIKPIHPIGYLVFLGLNKEERPISYSADLPEEDFLKFFELEIKYSHLDMVKYFIGELILPYLEPLCGCDICGLNEKNSKD